MTDFNKHIDALRGRPLGRVLVKMNKLTAEQVQQGLEKLMEGRTSIVIAHRLATVIHADEILVLEHGSIKEKGTHDQLIAYKGLYEKLSKLQLTH